MKTFRQLINEDLPPKGGDDIVMNPNQSELQEDKSHAGTIMDHLESWKYFGSIVKFNYTGNGIQATFTGKDGYTYNLNIRVSK